MNFNEIEVSQLSYHQLRQQFRADNLKRLRETELDYTVGEDGRAGWVAKGDKRSMKEAYADYLQDQPTEFIVPYSEGLDKELVDLVRDANKLHKAEKVKFDTPEDAISKTFTPMMNVDIEDDSEVLAWTEKYNEEKK